MIDTQDINTLSDLRVKFEQIRSRLSLSSVEEQLSGLRKEQEDPVFWQNQENASLVSKEIVILQETIDEVLSIERLFNDAHGLVELEKEHDDPELAKEFQTVYAQLLQALNELEIKTFLSGPYDKNEAILSIHAGQGGSEACDWASMLSRMYMRYFERKAWKTEMVEESRTEDGLLKSATYMVHGPYAYGLLKFERGAHRLVRLSPFNADNLRQTSFAGVEVLPLIPEESKEIEVKPEEIEWQFTRAGGHGGQNVNKVNTAVILHHIPTDIIVECRSERYQEQNKKNALSILKSKLALLLEEKRSSELSSIKGEHKLASWGNQIRNYVLHPYHLVKDTRTKIETSDTQAVLDGDLDQFIQTNVRLLS